MKRIDALKKAMAEIGIEAMLVSGAENVTYLSGFTGGDSLCLICPQANYFITDFRYTEQAANECTGFNVVMHKRPNTTINDIISGTIKSLGILKMGFEDNIMTYKTYEGLKKALGDDIELIGAGGAIEEIRKIKSNDEIKCIEKAADIADKAFSRLLPKIKTGATEMELVAELEYEMIKLGSQGKAFDTILVSGKKTSLPHGMPGDKVLEEGDFVTLDFGASIGGYKSDMTRTLVIGKAAKEQKRIYDLVYRAQINALDAVTAGVLGSVPDMVAREVFGDMAIHFGHGLGHGVGLEIHENPRLSKESEDVLQAGNIVTVEPGLYIEGWGGVRIEDTVIVTKDGCRRLTKTPKELLEL